MITADQLREISQKADQVGNQIKDVEKLMLTAAKGGYTSVCYVGEIFEGTMQHLISLGLHTKTTKQGYMYETQISWEKENPFKN